MKTKGKAQKGKAKDAAVRPKKKESGKSGPTPPARYDIVIELPLRVRAASREEAHLLALRWLTDALLKTDRPAAIRVSAPRQAGAAQAGAVAAAETEENGNASAPDTDAPPQQSLPAEAPPPPTHPESANGKKDGGARAARAPRRREAAAGNGVS